MRFVEPFKHDLTKKPMSQVEMLEAEKLMFHELTQSTLSFHNRSSAAHSTSLQFVSGATRPISLS